MKSNKMAFVGISEFNEANNTVFVLYINALLIKYIGLFIHHDQLFRQSNFFLFCLKTQAFVSRKKPNTVPFPALG